MVGLVMPFTNKARNIETSKNFVVPINEIMHHAKIGTYTKTPPRMRIYSAHDF